jgi:iron complex outermembrane receptor protein
MKATLIVFLSCLFGCLYGQHISLVSGQVTSIKGEELSHITIMIYKTVDSVIVKSALTDSSGHFTFKNLLPNSYFVQITAIGFEKFLSPSFMLSTSTIDLGNLQLKAKSKVLEGVTIQATKPLIQQKVDMLVMNIENSILATGNNALELLEQAPYVSVDQSGSISLKGIQNVTVMIDGRLTYLSTSDLANFLRNTHASQIASIEIITNPSAKYEAAGNGGIINIKMKKILNMGLNGSINTNFQQGRLPTLTSGLNLNYRKGKINLYSGINHSKAERWTEDATDLNFYDVPTKAAQSTFSMFEKTFYHANSLNIRTGMDYTLSKKTTLGLLLTSFAGNEDEDAVNENKIHSYVLNIDSSLQTKHYGKSNWKRYAGNINFAHQFDSTGKIITLDYDYADFTERSTPDYLTSYYNANGNKTGITFLNANMSTGIRLASLKGDYEYPLSETLKFSAGFKSSKVKTKNSIAYFQDGVFDTKRSNDFDYKETINAAYIDVSKEFEKISLKFGFRTEQTISIGNQLTQHTQFKQEYIQLFPTGFFMYKWNEKHSSGITINRRIGRPDYESLNPFIYLSDPYNTWGGNPYLQPALTSTVEANHDYKGIFDFFATYTKTSDALSRLQIKDTVSSGIFSTWANLGQSSQLSAGLSTVFKITKWWRMNNNLLFFKMKSSGNLGALAANTNLSSYRIYTINNFIISKKINAELNARYRPATLWGISKTGPIGSVSVGIQAKILKDNGSIKISGNDIFKSMRMNTTSAYVGLDSRYHSMSETQMVRIAFNYRFGRKQVKEVRERTTALEDETNRVKGRE